MTDQESSKVAMLRRGAVIWPDSVTVKNQIAKDYIIKVLEESKLKGPKIWVLKSATGTGKSTVLPSELWKTSPYKHIGLTQPQRLTAEEIPYDIMKHDPTTFIMGETIGYQTGLVNRSTPKGLIFMTTGILYMHLTHMPAEQFMRRYQYIFIDEVHKYDIMLELLLKEFKNFYARHSSNAECPILILMSATLNENELLTYYDLKKSERFIEVEGSKGHQIDEQWPTTAIGNPQDIILRECEKHKDKDIIIFMATSKQMTATKKMLEAKLPNNTVIEVLSKTIQKGDIKPLFKAPGKHGRIALATNAAETGITLPYLDVVIDTGLQLNINYSPALNGYMKYLGVVTQANAKQRRGRVGRSKPGIYIPLYTKDTRDAMQLNFIPEIYAGKPTRPILNILISTTEPSLEYSISNFETIKTFKVQNKFDPVNIGLLHNPGSEAWQLIFTELWTAGFIDKNWSPTLAGFISTRFRKTEVEHMRFIFSAMYFKIPLIFALLAAALLVFQKHFTMPKTPAKSTKSDLLNQMLWYQEYFIICQKKSMNYVREWCLKNELDYFKLLLITEIFYELVFDSHQCGLKTYWKDFIIQEIQNYDIHLQKASYHAYRLNTFVKNERIGACSTLVGKQKIYESRNSKVEFPKKPKFLTTDRIMFSADSQLWETGDYIILLDDIADEEIDTSF